MSGLRFNMGCGTRKLPGFVNVDAWPGCEPDEVVNLEQTPWPWADDCAQEIRFTHSLEHLGEQRDVFLAIVREIYRIAADGCVIAIEVPNPWHRNYLGDPTHVRPITPDVLRLFSKAMNDETTARGYHHTPLAHQLQVDLRITEERSILAEPYGSMLQRGELPDDVLTQIASERLNVVSEFQIKMVAHKPYGRP